MSMPFKTLFSSTALIAALPMLLAANTARADVASQVTNIGPLDYAVSSVNGISDNGAATTLLTTNTAYTLIKSYYWSASTGYVNIGSLGGNKTQAYDVSGDGSSITGFGYLAGDSLYHVFRWTAASGIVDLGTLGGTTSGGSRISYDGSAIVGYGKNASNQTRAFRWKQGLGFLDLGTLGGTASYGYGISSDGNVISGSAQITGNTAYHAFRWTQETGMVDLGTLGGSNSNGYALSTDGTVVAGSSQISGNTAEHAIFWTQETGMVDIGTLGGTYASARRVSYDNSVILGYGFITGNSAYHALRWTEETGLQDLNTLMANAGVDMSHIVLNNATDITQDNKYITGQAYFNGSSNLTGYLLCYDPENGCIGLTTASKQEEAAIDLASNQQIAMTESRSAANELMGFTRPMTMGTQTFSGAMFGSAMGYAGGQYTKDRFTLLGGLGYGAQDYKYIKPENALTVASGLRYTFDSVTGDAASVGALAPFVEAGGWYTPDMEVALSRPYNNGTGTNRGEGNTNSSSWAEYVKTGLVWDQSEVNQFTAYGELGRQHMLFDGYSETATSTNPFPATISDSEMTFNFARAGGSWTRQLDRFMGKPVSFTVAGAVAHSFGVKTNLTTTVSGVGTAHAIAKKNLWAEYGGRLSSDLTDNVALILDVTGTTGNNGMGTAIHGGAGVSLKF